MGFARSKFLVGRWPRLIHSLTAPADFGNGCETRLLEVANFRWARVSRARGGRDEERLVGDRLLADRKELIKKALSHCPAQRAPELIHEVIKFGRATEVSQS